MKIALSLALSFVLALPALAANPPRPYHLQLEASPAAPFPYLSKFGTIDLHVYAGGVRADSAWLDAFSRNGTAAVTVLNPFGRMYVDVPIREIAPTLAKLAGSGGAERLAKPVLTDKAEGKVHGIDATRYRLSYGPEAYIDYWTTAAVPESPQLRTVVDQLLRGIAPGTADVARTIHGVPVYVELNFSRFKKLPILKVKELTFTADDEEEALKVGALYVRASLLEALLR